MTEINKKLRSGLLPAPMIIKNYVEGDEKSHSFVPLCIMHFVRSLKCHRKYLLWRFPPLLLKIGYCMYCWK